MRRRLSQSSNSRMTAIQKTRSACIGVCSHVFAWKSAITPKTIVISAVSLKGFERSGSLSKREVMIAKAAQTVAWANSADCQGKEIASDLENRSPKANNSSADPIHVNPHCCFRHAIQ